jgi:hypothetical protein
MKHASIGRLEEVDLSDDDSCRRQFQHNMVAETGTNEIYNEFN